MAVSVRMKDVAAAAGVSVATVSRVLSGSRQVGPELRARILDLARELDYTPHAVARSLRSASTRTIGILVPAIDNPFFPRLITAAEAELARHGRALLIASSGSDPEVEALRMEMLAQRKVDGLLVCSTSVGASATALASIRRLVPVVQFDQRTDVAAAPFVGTDDAAGMVLVVEHLRARGARVVAHIGASEDNWSGRQRREAFVSACAGFPELEVVLTEPGDFSRDHGCRAAATLLASRPDVDAIACSNDLVATGVLDAAHHAGREVPGSLLVTGYDDIDVATVCTPRLTTVKQPFDELMRVATSLLLALVDGRPEDVPAETLLPVELVLRESTGLPPPAPAVTGPGTVVL